MKIYETGSNPYYLNISNTAKEYSDQLNTNSENSLVDNLSKNILIEKDYQEEASVIIDEFIIIKNNY